MRFYAKSERDKNEADAWQNNDGLSKKLKNVHKNGFSLSVNNWHATDKMESCHVTDKNLQKWFKMALKWTASWEIFAKGLIQMFFTVQWYWSKRKQTNWCKRLEISFNSKMYNSSKAQLNWQLFFQSKIEASSWLIITFLKMNYITNYHVSVVSIYVPITFFKRLYYI